MSCSFDPTHFKLTFNFTDDASIVTVNWSLLTIQNSALSLNLSNVQHVAIVNKKY